MSAQIKQVSFSGGEVSPTLYGRTDFIKYETGLRQLRNWMALRQGGATGRPGTQYVGTALNGGSQVRLIPFIFNETGTGQSYVIEFGNLYITFYQNGGNVISSTKTITGATNANPCVITSSSHGFSNGDIIIVSGVLGMTQLNNAYFIIANVTTNTFSLKDLLGNAIDSTLYTAYTSGGTANKIYTIVSPYAQADLQNLQFAESNDVITITHQSYPVYELRRLAATSWTITAMTFSYNDANNYPTASGAGTFGTAGTPTPWARYYVYAVQGNGDEFGGVISSVATSQALALATTGTPVNLRWIAPVNGASYYKIYRSTEVGIGAPPYADGPLGYLGQTSDTHFLDNGITPDFSSNPPIVVLPFQSSGNYPATVGYVQQRRVFANTINNPIGFWMSRPGDYSNFNTYVPPQDGDGIVASIAGEEVNSIQHILELKFMLMLTAGAEIYVQGNGTGVVTPTGINASTQSQYGSSALRPLKVGDVLLFNQALGGFIRDFSFDFSIDGYRGNDITIFSSHLFEGYTLTDWAYQKIPDSIVWAVRSDGTLLGLTYVREQQILAWHRHDFTNGVVENICSIPENGTYAVYLSIKRVINGVTVRYIERMSQRIWTDQLNATYMDCFVSYNGYNTGSTTMTLTASGGFSTTSSAYTQQLTLTASAGFFTSSMVGDQIFLQDALYVSSKGQKGNEIRCTIQAFTSSTIVTVTPNRAVPTDIQAIALTTWARAVKTVSGLGYLNGQQVSIWADRFLVASPLNSNVTTVYTVPSTGVLTLDKWYAVIYIGLPIVQDLETLDIDTSQGESILAKRKRTLKLACYTYNTRSFFVGSENPDSNLDNTTSDYLFQMEEFKRGTSRTNYDQPPELVTDQDYVFFDTRWNKNGRVFIRNVDPVPCTILAISPCGENPAPSPMGERV